MALADVSDDAAFSALDEDDVVSASYLVLDFDHGQRISRLVQHDKAKRLFRTGDELVACLASAAPSYRTLISCFAVSQTPRAHRHSREHRILQSLRAAHAFYAELAARLTRELEGLFEKLRGYAQQLTDARQLLKKRLKFAEKSLCGWMLVMQAARITLAKAHALLEVSAASASVLSLNVLCGGQPFLAHDALVNRCLVELFRARCVVQESEQRCSASGLLLFDVPDRREEQLQDVFTLCDDHFVLPDEDQLSVVLVQLSRHAVLQ